MSEELKTRYAIVGAGIAGIAAVEALREADRSGDLTLINGEAVSPYCRPLIVDVLRGESSLADIHLRKPEWFEQSGVSIVTGDPAVGLDVSNQRLELRSGRGVVWEKLLLATGSRPSIPEIEGLQEIPAFTLYRQDDIGPIRKQCKPGARAVVVGTGLIGLQAITALKELGVEIVAVEIADKILPMVLDAQAAGYAQRKLEENGVRVHTGTSIREVKTLDGRKHPLSCHLKSGEEVAVDFLVVAAGMKPDVSLINGSGVEWDRGIKISPRMETSVPDVYAAGDVTEYLSWIEGRSEIHAHWVNAYRQGRIAGLAMAGVDADPWEPVYLNSLDVFGMPIITMGASRIDEPQDAQVYISESPARPAYTRLVVRDGRLVAATFVNDVDRSGVFQYLMREKVDISGVAESLFECRLDGMEFLDQLHGQVVRGEIDWPESMDRIKKYRKDHKRTRWGKTQHTGAAPSPSDREE